LPPSSMPSSKDSEGVPVTIYRKLLQEAMEEFRATVRNDIQNLHLEIIKQSLVQQVTVLFINAVV